VEIPLTPHFSVVMGASGKSETVSTVYSLSAKLLKQVAQLSLALPTSMN
jgi:hypothetical protein